MILNPTETPGMNYSETPPVDPGLDVVFDPPAGERGVVS
jgi:hypothetical protein